MIQTRVLNKALLTSNDVYRKIPVEQIGKIVSKNMFIEDGSQIGESVLNLFKKNAKMLLKENPELVILEELLVKLHDNKIEIIA